MIIYIHRYPQNTYRLTARRMNISTSTRCTGRTRIACLLIATYHLFNVVAAFPSSTSSFEPILPRNSEDVIRQAAKSISIAYEYGRNLQSIRLPLSESMYVHTEEGFVADRAIGWQGGPQETLRYLSPIVSNLLKLIRMTDNTGRLVVKVSEQILLDFDGSSLQTSVHPAGALYDIQALLQPNTDEYYMKTIESIEQQFSNTEGKAKRLFLLINPAWRDKSSWGFFGGKKAQELILDRYETTYAVDQFVVRGRKVSFLKCYQDDWMMFVGSENDPNLAATFVATFRDRPKYDEIDATLLKYLRKAK